MGPNESTAKLRVKIGEKEIELQGEPAHVAQVIAHLLAQGTTVNVALPPAPAGEQPPPGGKATETDIHQFFDEKKPTSDNEAATAVAFYYAFVAPARERRDVIDKDLLVKGFTEARRKLPSQPSMTLVHARNAGYLSQAGRGTYRLTTVGQNLVTHTLGQPGRGEAPPRSPPKRKRPRKSGGKRRR